MKLAIVGSRNFDDYNLLKSVIDNISPVERFISGGAKGADALAREYARVNKVDFIEYLPEYKKYGKNAPLVRNRQIVDNADIVIAFWDGESRGTLYTIDYARKKGKRVFIVRF